MKKGVKLEWEEECKEAFDKIKNYISSMLVLVSLYPYIPPILYPTITTITIGAMLNQMIEGEEKAIYYTSNKFLEHETRYPSLEKTSLAFCKVIKKLKHYTLAHAVQGRGLMDLIKYQLQCKLSIAKLSDGQ